MRRMLTFVGMLAVAGLVALAPAPRAFADGSGGGERQDPLAVADRLEQEGRMHLEQGHMAEGAKLLSKAWAIRAEVFAHQDDDEPKPHDGDAREKPKERPELEALQARILALKARSNDAERAAKELKANGHPDEAQAKMEESGKLWREAEELARKLAAVRGQKTDRPAGGAGDGHGAELKVMLERLRASVAELRAVAEKEAAAGNEKAAHQAKERAEEQMRRIGELEGKLRGISFDVTVKPKWAPSPTDPVLLRAASEEGPGPLSAIHQQLEKLMRRMNEMSEKLKALEHRLQKAETDD